MDKYEYRLSTQEMLGCVAAGDYQKAELIADSIDWHKVKSVSMLSTVSGIYEERHRYEDARDILFIAYDRSPNSRKIIFGLTRLALKLGDIEEARDCYKEFCEVAPQDGNRHVLKYEIAKAAREPLSVQIKALEDFKKVEYVERWAYELARLYEKADMIEQCVSECDDLILWFDNGKYVRKALELKRRYRPLTGAQLAKYMEAKTAHNEEPGETPPAQEVQAEAKVKAEVKAEVEVSAGAGASLKDSVRRFAKGAASVFGAHKEGPVYKQEEDGQLNLMEELSSPEPQVSGQMDISDMLRQWEEKKKEIIAQNEAKNLQQAEEKLNEQNRQIIGSYETADDKKKIIPDEIRKLLWQLENNIDPDPEPEEENAPSAEAVGEEMPAEAAEQTAAETENEPEETVAAEEKAPFAEAAEDEGNVWEEAADVRQDRKAQEEDEALSANAQDLEGVEALPTAAEEEPEAVAEAMREPAAEEAPAAEPEAVTEAVQEPAAEEAVAAFDDTALMGIMAQLESSADKTAEDVAQDTAKEKAKEEEKEEAASPATEEAQEASAEALSEAAAPPPVQASAQEEAGEPEEASPAEEAAEPDMSAIESMLQNLVRETEEKVAREELKPAAASVEEALQDLAEGMEVPSETEASVQTAETAPAETAPAGTAPVPLETAQETAEDEAPAPSEAVQEKPKDETPSPLETAQETAEDEAPAPSEAVQETPKNEAPAPSGSGHQKPLSATQQLGGLSMEEKFDLDAQARVGLQAGLTEEQKKAFSYFVPVRGMSEQIVEALKQAAQTPSDGTSRKGNILIVGPKGCGKTMLGLNMIKQIRKEQQHAKGKAAVIHAETLNKKDVPETIRKVHGGALLIEDAGRLESSTVTALDLAMNTDTKGMIFVLEDDKEHLAALLRTNDNFAKKFTIRLQIPDFINDELVTFGQSYALEHGYKIADMGILALYSRIDVMQREDHSVTVAEVKDIMDAAFLRSRKNSMRKTMTNFFKSKDENELKVLEEEDFVRR